MPTTRDQSWISPHRPGKRELLRALEEALRDPDQWETAEQFFRYYHDDVAGLELDQLDDERWRLRTARAFGLITLWGIERLARLDRESEQRRRPTRR